MNYSEEEFDKIVNEVNEFKFREEYDSIDDFIMDVENTIFVEKTISPLKLKETIFGLGSSDNPIKIVEKCLSRKIDVESFIKINQLN